MTITSCLIMFVHSYLQYSHSYMIMSCRINCIIQFSDLSRYYQLLPLLINNIILWDSCNAQFYNTSTWWALLPLDPTHYQIQPIRHVPLVTVTTSKVPVTPPSKNRWTHSTGFHSTTYNLRPVHRRAGLWCVSRMVCDVVGGNEGSSKGHF